MCKPVIVHIVPWPFGLGGLATFVTDLAIWSSPWADIHVITPELKGEWDIPATIHTPATEEEADRLIRQLDPDLIHHHAPWFTQWKVDIDTYAKVGTHHGWQFQHESKLDWCVPICGSFPNKISHGVDLLKYTPKQHTDNDSIVVGIVGRRSWEKIPESFISYLEKNGIPEGVTLRVIGDGNCWHGEEMTMRLSKVGCKLVDDVHSDQMPEQYHMLDALLVPSLKDSVNYAALEAMACGLPVVARAVEGLPDTVGYAGFVCVDDQELMNAVVQLRNPRLREQLGIIARHRAETKYDIKRMMSEWGKVYEKVSNGVVRPHENNDYILHRTSAFKISVITTVYNTLPKYLEEYWQAMQKQTYPNWELILVDDGSTDQGTKEAIAKIKKDSRVKLVTLPENKGNGIANNEAVKHCGKWIAIMDSDDIPHPDWMEKMVHFLVRHRNVDILGCQIQFFDDETNRRGMITKHPLYITNEIIRAQSMRNLVWFINHPGSVYKKALAVKAGQYTNRRVCADLQLWLNSFKLGGVICNLPDLLVDYRQHEKQLTKLVEIRVGEHNEIVSDFLNSQPEPEIPLFALDYYGGVLAQHWFAYMDARSALTDGATLTTTNSYPILHFTSHTDKAYFNFIHPYYEYTTNLGYLSSSDVLAWRVYLFYNYAGSYSICPFTCDVFPLCKDESIDNTTPVNLSGWTSYGVDPGGTADTIRRATAELKLEKIIPERYHETTTIYHAPGFLAHPFRLRINSLIDENIDLISVSIQLAWVDSGVTP